MGKTRYLAAAQLNAGLRNTSLQVAQAYVALYTVAPTDVAGTGTEVTGGSYARQPINFNAPSVVSGEETSTSNGAVVFPVATADWGDIVAYQILDALTVGNGLYFDNLKGTDAVQALSITGSPTSGSLTLTGNSATTQPVPYNATPAQVQAALEQIYGEDNVSCSGTALPSGTINISFINGQGSRSQALLTHTDSLGGGSGPAAHIAAVTTGVAGDKTILSGDQFTFADQGIAISEF